MRWKRVCNYKRKNFKKLKIVWDEKFFRYNFFMSTHNFCICDILTLFSALLMPIAIETLIENKNHIIATHALATLRFCLLLFGPFNHITGFIIAAMVKSELRWFFNNLFIPFYLQSYWGADSEKVRTQWASYLQPRRALIASGKYWKNRARARVVPWAKNPPLSI